MILLAITNREFGIMVISNKRYAESSTLLAFKGGIHLWPMDSSHKGPVT